jgi:hypothetical protein
MGLFTAFVDASRAYSSVPREEIEPLRPEIREWLRHRDLVIAPRAVPSALGTDVSKLPDTAITPATRRTSPLLYSIKEAV